MSCPLPICIVRAPTGEPDGARASVSHKIYFRKNCRTLKSKFISMKSGNRIPDSTSDNVLQEYRRIFELKCHIFSLSLVL